MDGNHVKTRLVQGTPCWKMTVSLLVALMLASVLSVGVLPAYAEDMQEASAALEGGYARGPSEC